MEGYSKLAHLMATQHEFAIFRRFRALNIKSLLYLQADIAHDEAKLAELASRDSRYGDGEFQMKDWWTLSQGNETFSNRLENGESIPPPTINVHWLAVFRKSGGHYKYWSSAWWEIDSKGYLPTTEFQALEN